MALEASEGSSFDRDFEFDAPQWIDFAYEKDHLEDESINDQYDWWFQKVHPLHSPNLNPNPEPKPKPKMRLPQRSLLAVEGSKLSTETGQFTLTSSKTGLTEKSTSTSNPNLTKKSCLRSDKPSILSETRQASVHTSPSNPKLESIPTNNSDETPIDEAVKRSRKCWQLNGQSSVSFSPQAKLPEDLRPQRTSSNGCVNTKKISFSTLPARCSTDLTASPLTADEKSKKVLRSKSLRMARRSCPQKLHKTRDAWEDSSSTSKNDEDIGEEIQQLIEQHNRKILSQKSEYDLNGRKIRKTASPQKPGKRDNSKENLKPPQLVEVASSATVNEVMNEELRDIINSHNRRIWAKQNSTYDLNGRRVRKGRTTVVAPVTKKKSDVPRSPTKHKTVRRSNETRQKRKTVCQNTRSASAMTTDNVAFGADSKRVERSTDFESEIEDIINFHNSRLAAKKAKK